MECPLMDAAVFASIKAAQQHHAMTPVFLPDGNSQGGFGRCNSSCHQPAVPTHVSSLLGAGMVGLGSLRLISGENDKNHGGCLHVSINTHRVGNFLPLGFTVESWIQVPSEYDAIDKTISFVVAGSDYALALQGRNQNDSETNAPLVFVPLFFWAAAPASQCLTGPQVLIDSTGSIGDGPGLLPRSEKGGPLSCSWILSPGGSAGGFQEVTLIFTGFLLTTADSLALYSCFDSTCTTRSEATLLKGGDVSAPFVSTTPVMQVILTATRVVVLGHHQAALQPRMQARQTCQSACRQVSGTTYP